MAKIPILHDNTSKKEIINKHFIALIPLILFSIYKNGILLYINDLINIKNILIPIYFFIISIFIGFLISIILKEEKKENILLCLIISCTISINSNLIIYPILLFVSIFIGKFILRKNHFKFNIASFTRLLLILSLLVNSYSYLNIGEKLNKFNYNYLDIFIGHDIGGLANTSSLILLFSFLILLSCKFYKKLIPISASTTFIIINITIILITKDYDNINIILNGFNYFSFIFIAPDLFITPPCKEGMIMYGALIGGLSCILSNIGLRYEASFISIFIISLFIPLITKINNIKYLKN